MTEYSQEVIDKSEALLPVNLRYLFLEIELFLVLAAPTFIYTNELSTIWGRIGECEAQAEVINAVDVMQLMDDLATSLEKLRTEYTEALTELELHAVTVHEYATELSTKPETVVSVGNYKEEK